MPIEIKDTDNGSGNIITSWQLVTGGQYIHAIKKHFAQDKEKFEKYKYSLSVWTEVTQLDISTSELETIVDLCLSASNTNKHAIVGIAADQDIIYGTGRMFEALAKETGWEIMVYRSVEEAEAWTKERVLEKFKIKNITFI